MATQSYWQYWNVKFQQPLEYICCDSLFSFKIRFTNDTASSEVLTSSGISRLEENNFLELEHGTYLEHTWTQSAALVPWFYVVTLEIKTRRWFSLSTLKHKHFWKNVAMLKLQMFVTLWTLVHMRPESFFIFCGCYAEALRFWGGKLFVEISSLAN